MTFSKSVAFFEHGFRLAWSRKLSFFSLYFSRLVSVVFFYFIDQMLRRSGARVVEGSSYFTFLLIGGTFITYLDVQMRSFADRLREELLAGTVEPALVTATPVLFTLTGPSFWPVLEGAAVFFLQLLAGALLGADFSQANWLTVGGIVLVSTICLLSYGILAASFTLVFKRGDPLTLLIAATAYVFSGVFFPIAIMPPFFQTISYLLPFTYALNALRRALIGGSTLGGVAFEILVLSGYTAVFIPLALFTLRRAIRHLRDTGTIGHY